jgi:hypothetical protein
VQGGGTDYTDINGTPTIDIGAYTYTSGPWSGVTINSIVCFDALGNPTIVVGPQPNGKRGIGIYNQSGVLLTLIDTNGMANFDSTGQPRATVGILPSGDAGLAVYDRSNSGVYQELLPASVVTSAGLQTITSTSQTSLGVGPTATIGASGKAIVRLAAYVGTTASNQSGTVTVYIDGVTASTEIVVGNTGTQIAVSAEAVTEATGLTPGSHTFVAYATSSLSGTAVNVSEIAVEVQPI